MLRTTLCLLVGVLGLSACSSSRPDSNATTSEEEAALTELPASVDESALDRTANPCTDFFQFACGGYVASVTVGDNDRKSRAFTGNSTANAQALEQIFSYAAAHTEVPVNKKLTDYETACMMFNRVRQPGAYTAAMEPELGRIRAGKGTSGVLGRALMSTAGLDTYGAYFQPVFSIQPDTDRDGNPDVVALNISPSMNVFGSDDEATQAVADTYPTMSADDQAARAKLMMQIDKQLGAILATMSDAPDYHPIDRAALAVAMPHVDWDLVLSELGVPHAKKIVAWNLKQLTQIDAMLGALSVDDLTKYLELKVVTSYQYVEVPEGVDADTAAKRCRSQTGAALSGIVEYRFVDTVLGKKNTKVATAMAKKVLGTFQARLRTTDFLDAATRAEAITKADEMHITPLRAPRDDYADLAVDGTNHVQNRVAVWARYARAQFARVDRKPLPQKGPGTSFSATNAFYDPTTNSFTILPGIAHGTFFGGSSAPAAHNFGALGWVIGHEMTHGFDNNGRLFDGHGADRNWWTPEAEAAFNQRAACFVDEYTGFVLDGVTDPATGQPAHVDGQQTLGENIADNGGVRTAYEAAKAYFPQGKPDAGFTPEQQFFVAAGQMWCEKAGKNAAVYQLHNDPHSPGKARVNETLSNFDAFAKAFQCKAGDKMVAQNACVLW